MKAKVLKRVIAILFVITSPSVYAYAAEPLPISKAIKIKWNIKYFIGLFSNFEQKNSEEEEEISNLVKIEEDYNKSSDNRKAMIRLLKTMKVKRAFRNKRYSERLFNDLAHISAKLKLYPLAMQYYSQSMQPESDAGNTSPVNLEFDSTMDVTGLINMLLKEDSANNNSSKINNRSNSNVESNPVTANEIIQSFEDGKSASGYALILHTKQPKPGKRKAFSGIDNVGHMFITLIKYNSDKSFISRSFGFYPNKNNVFAATPLHPAALPVFKDDALHDWDEAIGKFISHRRFIKVIKVLTKYEFKMYNLSQNNCTDFGLTMASLSGINILETTGKWPFGKGNNPANAGQSILEGRIMDEDAGNKNGLFILNGINPLPLNP